MSEQGDRLRYLTDDLSELASQIDDMVPATWHGLMMILDRVYPERVFPTKPDDSARGGGARIISLLRRIDEIRKETGE